MTPAARSSSDAAKRRIPASAFAWIRRGYEILRLDLDADLDPLGVPAAPLAPQPEQLVSIASYAALLERALSRRRSFAVEAGHLCPFGTFPLLDCTVSAQPSLRAALSTLARYLGLVTGNGTFRLDGPALELVPTGIPMPEWFRVASFEFGLHYTAARIDDLVGRPAVRSLEVPWPQPAWSHTYPRPTAFSSPRAAILLDPAALDADSRRADPLVAELLARNATAALTDLSTDSPHERAVRRAIAELLPTGRPDMERVAASLATSPRTLRRHLAEEGTTFDRVRDAALAAIARDRLRDPSESTTDIAFALGFSDVRSFHRAFRRWTGTTPGRYRRAGRAGLRDPGA